MVTSMERVKLYESFIDAGKVKMTVSQNNNSNITEITLLIPSDELVTEDKRSRLADIFNQLAQYVMSLEDSS